MADVLSGLLDTVIHRYGLQANAATEGSAFVLSLLCFHNNRHGLCRLNAETESDTKENAGKLLAHIGRSRVSPLTSLMPQHLQPMLEKAFAAQQGSQLKQVITVFYACSASAAHCNAKLCLLCLVGACGVWGCQVLLWSASLHAPKHHLLFASLEHINWSRRVC